MMIKLPWNTPKIKINSVYYQRLGMRAALKMRYLLCGTFVFPYRQLKGKKKEAQ